MIAYCYQNRKGMRKIGCSKPMIRCETWDSYKCDDGHIAYKAEFWKYNDINYKSMETYKKMAKSGKYRKIQTIPCGHCVGCRLDNARDKAVQLSLEKKNPIYKENECWFLTLTYDDVHMRIHTTINQETGELLKGSSIQSCDMQNFWKRLRKNKKLKNLKYLNCMEYGKTTYRPHGHAIAFGLPLDLTKLKKVGNNEMGDALWISEELTEEWGLGKVVVGEVTFRSISYVARYTLKKTTEQLEDEWWYKSQGKDPEWISMSQGMGRWYYEKYKHRIYGTDTVPVKDNNGQLCRPPKAYDRLYKKEFPKLWEEVAKKREEQALVQLFNQEQSTDLKGYKYKKVIAEKQSQFKDLRKEGNYGL